MSGVGYAIMAYIVGLGLIALYGLRLWMQWRKLRSRRRADASREA